MRLTSILVGMDFSETAIKAARWASQQFAPAASITLAHVIDPPDRPRFSRHLAPSAEEVESVAREYAERRLHDVVREIGVEGVRSEIRVGKPHEALMALARELAADLVVVGPHGDRPRPSKFLGTTADRIVRTSAVPVLVATSPPPGPPRKILVPVDDFSITPIVLTWTRDLAEAFDADVELLHVWSNATYSHVASMSYATEPSETAARVELNKEMHDAGMHWLGELARTGINRERVTTVVRCGKPGDVSLEVAAAISADLIVLGRRGSGLVRPALLGSTVGTVLHGARCPILVVTEPPESEREG